MTYESHLYLVTGCDNKAHGLKLANRARIKEDP
jgi:hypothetical protein